MKKRHLDMTEGNMGKTLIFFMLPLIGSSIFQQLYNTADFLFVGNILGKTAAAAVGASSTLIFCTIGLFSGISVGTSVVISQAVGARQREKTERALHSSVLFGLTVGSAMMLAAIFVAPAVLRLLNTPESIMSGAVLYMRIYFLSMPMSIVYNMGAGALRACGDSQTPFRILVFCGLVNVAADAVFIIVIPMGVAGVAIATVAAQVLSAFLVIRCLQKAPEEKEKEAPILQFSWKKLSMDFEVMKEILRIGLPSGIQSIVITFSNVMVQYYINGFGETAIAAFATYYRAENLIYLPIMAFGQAATTFAGQNAGAGKFKRLRSGIIRIAAAGAAITVCIAGVLLAFSETVFGWFINDADVVKTTILIASVSFPFYWIYPIMESLSGALRGMGYSVVSMAIILTNLCGIRILLLAVFSATIHTIQALASVYPITWALAAGCFIVVFTIVMRKKCRSGELIG